MVTTISGTTITFTDGSTWGGANGTLTPDTNTSRTSQSFNIGHIILGNCIFRANTVGYSVGGQYLWALNNTDSFYFTGNPGAGATMVSGYPAANISIPADDSRLGSQSYYALGGPGGTLTGSWRARGMACAAGINQTNGFFVLLERVA